MGLSRRAVVAQVGMMILTGCAPKRGAPAAINIGYQKNGVLLLAKSRGVAAAAV